ncbi:Phosphocarrier protein HPr [Apilactobacillus kunkeei]|uniref:Phosphocarrier protein HPr n=5 Tax=Apilactobacillus TaxID=2767877 RepID=A0A087EPR9_9LACO|nr:MULTISPECIES: phosphocarrier protein HPr [Lactobacillaceae]MBI0092014.1 phosphocarrier protein HPr [Lactobacillus sp. M0345]MCL8496292.1 phosphocarrier protein HPr [Apilactobacillus sp. F1]ALJ31666.1 phosphocarrier protein HPr [Apilactobacillus kunkeei]KDB00588.1 phosphocarrier, HPr family protein [Apilactobacillus kunkeei EFB6]KFJ15270.1 phosphocarrier protein HPr [Apilactobacillus kunkeei]
MEKRQFKVVSETGIHARPATLLVQTATKFKSELKLEYLGNTVDLKSIMGVMSLGVGQNAEVTVIADGPDEKDAIEAIAKSFKDEGLTD